MTTDIQVINSALAKIRCRLINDLDEGTTESKLCKVLYPTIRDRLLRQICPNFAKQRIELAQLTETPKYQFQYVFQIPVDVIKIVETDCLESDDWKQESRKIYANRTTFFIDAIMQVTDAEQYDAIFSEALACSLAAELAIPLTNGTQIYQALNAKAEEMIKSARTAGSQERGSIDVPEATSWLNSRF